MNNLYCQLSLDEKTKKHIDDISNSIVEYVLNKKPELKDSWVWGISKNNSFAQTKTKGYAFDDLLWDDIETNVIGVSEFYKQFKLKYGIAYGMGQPVDYFWQPHRHTFPENSNWTLTHLIEGSDPGYVNFYKCENDKNYSTEEYDLRPEDSRELIIKKTIFSGETFSLNSTVWHNWTPLGPNTRFAIFSLDAETIEQRDSIINSISQEIQYVV